MNPLAEFAEAFLSGVRPFVPTVRSFLVAALASSAAMLLGAAIVVVAREASELFRPLLLTLGETLILGGAVALGAASVRLWWVAIRQHLRPGRDTGAACPGGHR